MNRWRKQWVNLNLCALTIACMEWLSTEKFDTVYIHVSITLSVSICVFKFNNSTSCVVYPVQCNRKYFVSSALYNDNNVLCLALRSFGWSVLLNYNSIRPTQMFFDNFCAHFTYFQYRMAIMIIIHLIAEINSQINSQFSAAPQLFLQQVYAYAVQCGLH